MQAIVIFLLVLTPLSWVIAAEPLSVVINEIAWMGTEKSYSDEWIELYNNSSDALLLEGWQLISENNTPKIDLKGEIPAGGFFLLERTDDETVPNITADLIYRGALENEGEHLKLIDDQGEMIDELDYSAGWFAGDNASKKTMERKNPLALGSEPENWQTSRDPGGTPKAENQSSEIRLLDIKIKEEQSYEVEPRRIYPSNIFINEILPSPEGADVENEWLELFNGNNFEVALADWQIRDTVGATKTYTIPEGTKIGSNGFLVLLRPETKITLQNSGDSLELLNPNGEIIHQANYPKAPLGQSFNRTSTGWAWSETLTPGKTNIITIPEALETKPSETFGEREGQIDSGRSEESKKVLAKIGEQLPKASSPLTVFLIALGIAISSAIVVLFLKKRAESEI